MKSVLDRADGVKNPQSREAAAVTAQLTSLASDIERDAALANAVDARHLRLLSADLKERAQKLR